MGFTILNAIRPGDKLEIHYVNKLNKDIILETLVYDIESEDVFLIHNPLVEGKIYMIPMHVSVTIIAMREDYGVIAFSAYLQQRKKIGNIYTIATKVTSELRKQQRRNFYRVKVYMDVEMYIMVDSDMQPVDYYIFDPDAVEEQQVNMRVTLLDVSGGGVGIKTSVPLPIGTIVYTNLDFLDIDGEIYGEVVRCEESYKYVDEYEIGISFLELPPDIRRILTAFVFTRQQKARRKEIDNG